MASGGVSARIPLSALGDCDAVSMRAMTLVNFRHFFRRKPFGSRRRARVHLERSGLWTGADYGQSGSPKPASHSRYGRFEREAAIRPKTIGQGDAVKGLRTFDSTAAVEDPERTLPMPGLRVVEMRIDHLERPRERDATGDNVKLGLGFLAQIQIERGSGEG
jgi:hypothetical protein